MLGIISLCVLLCGIEAYLDFIHVAYGMIKLDRTAALEVGLVASSAVKDSSRRLRSWRLSVACIRLIVSWSLRHLRTGSLLLTLESTGLGSCLHKETGAVLSWCAKAGFGTLDAVMRTLWPLASSFWEQTLGGSATA